MALDSHAETPTPRVLVADDNRDAADSLSLLLSMLDCEVRTAYDGAQAIAIAREFRPSLVLLDLCMPVLDGLSAARVLRAEPAGQGLALVAVTALATEADKAAVKAAGFDAHLPKPLDLDRLRPYLRAERSPIPA
jgi:CheY-like chemotaxis protein